MTAEEREDARLRGGIARQHGGKLAVDVLPSKELTPLLLRRLLG
jgi:hypothetical protein